jgi:hypothetical protein
VASQGESSKNQKEVVDEFSKDGEIPSARQQATEVVWAVKVIWFHLLFKRMKSVLFAAMMFSIAVGSILKDIQAA